MRGEYDPIHDRRPGTARRGRRPYDDPVNPACGVPPRAEPPHPGPVAPYGTAEDPFSYGSWVSIDVTPFRSQVRRHPPAPPQWSWREFPRDRFLRSALIFGFLAAAGVGILTSGWTPASRPSGTGAAPLPPSPAGLRDTAVAPASGTAAATPTLTPTSSPAPASSPAPSTRPTRDKARGASPAGRSRAHRTAGEGRERRGERARKAQSRQEHGRRAAARTPQRPRSASARTRRAGRAERPGRASWAGRADRPGAPNRPEAAAPRPEAPRPGAPRVGGGPRSGTGSGGGSSAGGPSTGSDVGAGPANAASPTAPHGTGTTGDSSSTATGNGSSSALDDRLSAAYACRQLRPDDWRYAYCVTAWNEYKKRLGLP